MNNDSQMKNTSLNNKKKDVSDTKQSSQQSEPISDMASIQKVLNKNEQPPQTTNNKGFLSNLWNKIKSYWIIEEEDYIDAHGFPAKRPKQKIPLLNKNVALKRETNYEGGNGLVYASMHSPFGRVFL